MSTTQCRRCETPLEPGADRCPNPKCHSFAPKNQAARTTGLRAVHHPPDLRLTSDELIDGIVSDLGGLAALSTLEVSYVRKLGDLEVTLRLLMSDIARRGLITPSGNPRSVYDKLLTGLATFDKYAQRVGMARRAKPTQSLHDVLMAHEADDAD